jgi:hypothetical protein
MRRITVGLALASLAIWPAMHAEQTRAGADTRLAGAVCGKLLPPATGAYFGAFTDFNSPDWSSDEDWVKTDLINQFEQLAGRKLVWAYFTEGWYVSLDFPRRTVLDVWRNGQIPFIRFEPSSAHFAGAPPLETLPEQTYTLQHIIDGQFDAQLRRWADAARDTNIPLLVEFGPEVNDDNRPWNAKWNGAGQTDGYGDPNYPDGAERFRDAFRHIVDLFRGENATNVTWFFHADGTKQWDWWNELKWYYPGDDYIDWIGITEYGNLSPDEQMIPFTDKLDASSVYNDLSSISQRPLSILETGAVENGTHQKAAWITPALGALSQDRYPRIHAVSWWSTSGGVTNTRIDTSPDTLQAFRTAISNPYFNPQPVFSGSCAPPAPSTLTATASHRAVHLTWQGSDSATSYQIWRSGKKIGQISPTTYGRTMRYDDTRELRGRRYIYRVRAGNPTGTSAFSNAVSARLR